MRVFTQKIGHQNHLFPDRATNLLLLTYYWLFKENGPEYTQEFANS